LSVAVSITGVHKFYGELEALKGIDFAIEEGEFFGLLGPNGAGKSTLITIMAGLTLADRGQISIMGHDVVQRYRQARHCLGVVPQEVIFDPFFTVREMLRIQSGYFGLGKENDPWIDELLDGLMLSDKAEANMRTLSGGMKRRALVAQALVHKPKVVVLDEPTAGVDVELRKTLWAFIQRLHKNGHTILLTTHYLEEAESLCDRIGILDHGSMIALDKKDALMDRGIGRVRRLCITTTGADRRIPESLADKIIRQDDNCIELQLEKNIDSIGEVLDALRQADITVVDLHCEEADLEDVFIDLTRTQDK